MRHNTLFSFAITIATILSCITVKAQNNDNHSALIPLTVIADEQTNIPDYAQTALRDKLMQVVVSNGLGSNDNISRFAITASILEQGKDFVAGPPQQVSAAFDITLYIVDNYDHKLFSSVTIPSRAVEYSIEKALMRSIRSLKVKSNDVVSFVERGRNKIIDYYNQQIGQILAKAHLLATQRNYEEAFYILEGVPEACTVAYNKALVAGNEIYRQYADYVGAQLLAKAKMAWAAQQNAQGAAAAGEFLSQIDPLASCFPQAEKLYAEIKAKVLDDWKFEMKIYGDSVSLEKDRIKAWRDVGVAYGNHQPNNTNNVAWLLR